MTNLYRVSSLMALKFRVLDKKVSGREKKNSRLGMLMARREGTININIGGRCKLLHRRLPRQDTRYPAQNAGLSPLVRFYVCPLTDQGDTKRERLGMFEWPGFRQRDDADDNEEKRVGTFRQYFVNFSPHNKMMRSISKNARQCLGRSRSSLFLWMSVTVFWRTDEWESLSRKYWNEPAPSVSPHNGQKQLRFHHGLRNILRSISFFSNPKKSVKKYAKGISGPKMFETKYTTFSESLLALYGTWK